MQILFLYFPIDDNFWNYFHKYQVEYFNSLLLEDKKHFNNYSLYTKHEFEKIAAGKSAMAKIYPTALAILNKSENNIIALENSFDAFAVASQLYDYLRDWKTDFKSKKYSYLLSTLIERKGLQNKLEEVSIDEVGRMVYYTSLADDFIDLIIESYEKSLSELENVNCNDWKMVIKIGIAEIKKFREELNEIKNREFEKIAKK